MDAKILTQKNIASTFALLECIEARCSDEKDALRLQEKKFYSHMNKLMQDKTLSEAVRKAQFDSIAEKFYRAPQRRKLLDAQLERCYDETRNMLIDSSNAYLYTKPMPRHLKRLGKYYQYLLTKPRITTDDLLKEELVKQNSKYKYK